MKQQSLEPEFLLPLDDRVQVLNHGDTFAILNRSGNILSGPKQIQGLYNRDTRFIHLLNLQLNDQALDLLSSTVTEENDTLSCDLNNPTLLLADGTSIPAASLHIRRSQLVKDHVFYEKLELSNYLDRSVPLSISLQFRGDFTDIFEVRGLDREKKGMIRQTKASNPQKINLAYQGLDGVERKAIIHFSIPFSRYTEEGKAYFALTLPPKGNQLIDYAIHFEQSEQVRQPVQTYVQARELLGPGLKKKNAYFPIIETSNEQFTHWINRSQADLVSLMADTPYGKYPYAGVPWYNTAFGRDGIITAYQTLWLAPELSKDVLLFLAAHQAQEINRSTDAEPGKILHETRRGEMVALNEVPFKQYYGTIDATPLFVLLAGEYYQRTGDLATIQHLWNHIKAALSWIDQYGDQDGDGFVEYHHKAENGLTNQGWKDSYDAISYQNGQLAKPPIALCEVQGYVYAAKIHAAKLARLMGEKELEQQLETQAAHLKKSFNEQFWDDTLNTYIIALDGDKRPCRIKSSNAGQVLFTGIAYPHLANKLVRTLFEPTMFCGWGIRTLASDEVRYNPMSYHNGSIWPHDVSLIAEGLAKYGFKEQATRLTTSLFDASLFIPLQRLPELFCGFERRPGEGPTSYPVACSPQAWSVSSVFLLLKSLLGIRIVPKQQSIYLENPLLPPYLERVVIKNLHIGSLAAHLELNLSNDKEVTIKWVNQPKDWKLVMLK